MSNVAGAPVPLRLGDTEYRMSPLDDGDLAELDLWLRAEVIKTARASLDESSTPGERELTMRAAHDYAGRLTVMSPEGARRMATLDGIARYVYFGIRRNHPEVTATDIRAALLDPRGAPNEAEIDRAMDAFALANGTAEKKARSRRRASRRRKAKRRRQAGRQSTGD